MADSPRETPTFAQVIRDSIDARLAELHTAMPGEIVSYDESTGLASVQPSLKRKFKNGDVKDLPIISNVPVLFPRGGGAVITFDMQKGDPVLLVFCERSIDTWTTTGGSVDPKDPRKHHLSDAVAYPGIYPKVKPANAEPVTTTYKKDGSVITKNQNGTMTFTPDGGLMLENGGLTMNFAKGTIKAYAKGSSVDFFTQLLLVIDKFMQTTKVATVAGLQPFIPDPTYVQERAKLDPFLE